MTGGRPTASKQVYNIRIGGALAESWSEWFDGIEIEHELASGSSRLTVLTGAFDQSTLHGILTRIRDLNLKLISVTSINTETLPGQSNPKIESLAEITHQNHPPGR